MKKTKTRLLGLACGLGLLSVFGISGMTASAYTPADVAAYAYEIGYPNASAYVNQAYALIDSGKIPEEDIPGYCAKAMAALQEYAAQREKVVEEVFDEAAGNTTTQGTASGSGNSNSSNTSAQTGNTQTTGTQSVGTGANGTQSSATMTDSEFIQLSLEEKIEYVNSLPSAQRKEFISGLSNDARNSILKEMDTDKQLEMIESMMNTSDAFGLNFSVDSISDDAIVISSRDEDGNLMSVTTLGNSVEETGISYTMPLLAGGGAILLACAGIGGTLWYMDRKNNE